MAKATKARRAKSSGGGKRWIQGAIKHPGSLTRAAKSAGMTTQAYAQAHRKSPGALGKRARLAITLKKIGGRK